MCHEECVNNKSTASKKAHACTVDGSSGLAVFDVISFEILAFLCELETLSVKTYPSWALYIALLLCV